jgi:hypothetical protein
VDWKLMAGMLDHRVQLNARVTETIHTTHPLSCAVMEVGAQVSSFHLSQAAEQKRT